MDNWKRHAFAIGCGVVGGIMPNKKSNIHPLLLGAIFSILFVKIVFGDLDTGYQWSRWDIVFLGVTGLEGMLGAALGKKLIVLGGSHFSL